MRAVIIGAGSVGANVAYQLAKTGHDVVVLESGEPAQATTGASISWLSNFPQVAHIPPDDLPLRGATNEGFRRLHTEIGGDWLHWTGTLTWAVDPTTRAGLRQDRDRATELGFNVALLTSKQATDLDPALRFTEGSEVLHEPEGGWVDAPLLVETLLNAATILGATVKTHTQVNGVQRTSGRLSAVTTSNGEEIEADVVVNAAGSHACHVAALAGCTLSMDLRPGLVVYAVPKQGGRPRHVLDTPLMNIRPDPGAGVAIHWRGENPYGHHSFNATDPRQVVDAAARWLPALSGVEPSASKIGIRPVPPGGPVVGAHPAVDGFYIAVSHGGVGWGPLWGRLAAQEITGVLAPELRRWRPNRFLSNPIERPEDAGWQSATFGR